MNTTHLLPTALLDFDHVAIRALVVRRQWRRLSTHDRIGAVYAFVRDEIGFGYNEADTLSASRVLADGYGQCNTKTTLLMALLRAVGVPCRLHGATVDKRLQKGVVDGLFYLLAPRNIIHTWAEVFLEGRWVGLEGVILDAEYLRGVRATVPADTSSFLGFAVGTADLQEPEIEWRGTDTAIQSTAVNRDFGVYDDPDSFYRANGENLSLVMAWLYELWIRHALNRKVDEIRSRTPSAGSHVALPGAPEARGSLGMA